MIKREDEPLLARLEQRWRAESDPAAWEAFLGLLEKSEDVDLEKFIEEIDESAFSLKDWVEAFLGFEQWMIKNRAGVNSNFSNMLGYLHCCQIMIADNLEAPELQAVVNQCLTQFGYDYAAPLEE